MEAHELLDRVHAVLRAAPPPGFAATDIDAFVARHRPTLLQVVTTQLSDRDTDLWTPARRTKANLRALRKLAGGSLDRPEDRLELAKYSGWGGLSLEAVRDRWPEGIPAPDPAGLVHEYYTPTRVARELARVLRPALDAMTGPIRALEPSAGIGRLVRALKHPRLVWQVVERSPLSARLLQVLRPELPVFEGPFERWVAEHGAAHQGQLDLVVANPPYGPRGASITDDPDRRYRHDDAWAYFLTRCLDLLRPGGLGVFLIPSGFLTGSRARALREQVLRSHHLAFAVRLPSDLFPGAELVTDLLFLRARGELLPEVADEDRELAEGRYFELHPEHILGTEVHDGRRYRVEGVFDRLPDLVERPLCAACVVPTWAPPLPPTPVGPHGRRPRARPRPGARPSDRPLPGARHHRGQPRRRRALARAPPGAHRLGRRARQPEAPPRPEAPQGARGAALPHRVRLRRRAHPWPRAAARRSPRATAAPPTTRSPRPRRSTAPSAASRSTACSASTAISAGRCGPPPTSPTRSPRAAGRSTASSRCR
jgi:hypothetical protein